LSTLAPGLAPDLVSGLASTDAALTSTSPTLANSAAPLALALGVKSAVVSHLCEWLLFVFFDFCVCFFC
jgi:hypothetical protein